MIIQIYNGDGEAIALFEGHTDKDTQKQELEENLNKAFGLAKDWKYEQNLKGEFVGESELIARAEGILAEQQLGLCRVFVTDLNIEWL